MFLGQISVSEAGCILAALSLRRRAIFGGDMLLYQGIGPAGEARGGRNAGVRRTGKALWGDMYYLCRGNLTVNFISMNPYWVRRCADLYPNHPIAHTDLQAANQATAGDLSHL